MNTNQLMTAGAVAFAGFALWYITRTPGGQVAKQSGQQQRDAGLQAWMGDLSGSYTRMASADYWSHMPDTSFTLTPGAIF